jgi:nucleoprotein TPR
MRTRAKAVGDGVFDTAYLANTFGITEQDVQSLLEAPTIELVRSLFEALTEKGQEFEHLKTEKLKVDVELENTVRTAEAKVKAHKSAAFKNAKEIEEVRNQLNESEAAREALAAELANLQSSATGSSAETSALRQRIETLEASNRDALALVESKSIEKDQIATELAEQHGKLLALRREIGDLQDQTQALENAASSQKFREQSLHQEIEQLKRNLDWHTTELQTRNVEHGKFRKERNARVATLQRELEDTVLNVETMKRTESQLRQRLEELQSKTDDAFTRIANLEEEAIRKQQDFKTELDSSRRLAELQAQSATTHKERLHEIQQQADQMKEDAAEEIGRLQAEVETERSDKEEAEHKVAELEMTVERLEQQGGRDTRPGTPLRNGHGDPQTPRRIGSGNDSPIAVPTSLRKSAGGLTFSQLYTKFSETQEELENERRRTDKLSVAMDELINEMESRKPEIEELRSEQERLESQVLDFSRLLDEATELRDASVRNADIWQGEAAAAAREGEILRQQLRDLSAQVKILLVELSSRDQGLGEMSADERFELERAARGEVDEESLEAMTNTGRLISERLVLFRDASELVERNEQLLRLTREMGDKMEGEEAREKARQSAADAAEVDELRRQVERYRDEIQSTALQIDSYMKERDLFRRMLQHRGQLPPDADVQAMFGQSVVPATPIRGALEPPATPRSKEVDEMNKLLKEQQIFFDQFRNESTSDRRVLKDQVDALGREKSAVQADLARAQSQLSIASSRFETLQSNYTSLQNENQQHQKRSQQMAENSMEQDRRVAQFAEDLVEAKSNEAALRHETANAKAERDIFKRSEARLNEDIERLREDRARLNKLVTDLQNLQNEKELTESEARRRLQNRVDALEAELADNQKKLQLEIDEHKKATLRREYEENHNRTRIDDLVQSLSNVREELIAAKTARDQLQVRVEELKIDLHTAEEKVNVLQPRPTPRVEVQQEAQQENGDGSELPVEQRLALEISELKRDLEYAKTDLENTKQQVQVYRSISQASEEELASFSATADQYKEETEAIVAQKDARIKELEQRIEDLTSELTTTNSELSELRTNAESITSLLAEQKAIFESDLTRLRDDADRHAEEKKLFQEDLKAQAAIAQQAQQSYEDELVKHADAARSLQLVRKDFNDARTSISTAMAEAEAAKISLERGEESWKDQRERFEADIEELKLRRHDVDEQNKLLHKQMEAFSNELASLRQGRSAASASSESNAGENVSADATGNYQEVIKYLRREKEIVDVQHELSVQECKRLQQQLDYAEGQLQETKQKLSDERRQAAEKASEEGSTTRLMQTINELNLYRESSITLRNEAKLAREKLEEKSKDAERLLSEIEPLQGRVNVLEADIESKEGELKLLQADRDHWRERTQNIISKYDRVDPAELEEMKTQLATAKTEKESLEAAQNTLNEEISALKNRLENEQSAATQSFSERLDKFKGQAKEQDRKRQAQIRDLTAEKDSLTAELERSKSDLIAVNSELEQGKIQLGEALTRAENAEASKDAEDGQIEEGEVNAEPNAQPALPASAGTVTSAAHEERVATLTAEAEGLRQRVADLESQIQELQQQLQAAPTSGSDNRASLSGDDLDTLNQLKEDLARAQKEVEVLRTNNVASAPASGATGEVAGSTQPASVEAPSQEVAAAVLKLKQEMEAQHALALQQMETQVQARIEKLKENLKKQLRDERQARANEHSVEIKKIQDEHEVAMHDLKEAHRIEIERLLKEGSVAVAKAEGSEQATTEAAPSAEDAKIPVLTDAQVKDLIKTNASVKAIFAANLRAHVAKQTEPLNTLIATKDQEIAQLKVQLDKLPNEPSATSADTVSRAELEKQLDVVREERDAAVRQATENAEKKAKVQVSQRDMAQAKLAVVKKAATETPDKPVKEVWEIADKARPAAKPPTGLAPSTASPAAPKPIPQAQNANTPLTNPPAGSFGRPSGPGGVPGTPPNPQAVEFKPTAAAPATIVPASGLPTARTGIPQPGRGGAQASGLPRSIPARPPSATGMHIQGAAQAGRGGLAASGLPRGGAAGRGVARGGRGGGNAGQKRQHDGGDRNDDGKRQRSVGGAEGGGA